MATFKQWFFGKPEETETFLPAANNTIETQLDKGNTMTINFAQITSTLSAVAGLLPIAATLVQAVEATMPAGTPGAVKLEVVRVGIQTAYNSVGAVETEFAALWPHLSTIISAVVTALNGMGIFKKAAVAA